MDDVFKMTLGIVIKVNETVLSGMSFMIVINTLSVGYLHYETIPVQNDIHINERHRRTLSRTDCPDI